MQYSRSILAFKPLINLSFTSYLLSLHLHHRFMFLLVSLHLWLPLPPLTPSGFFNETLGVCKPEAQHFYTVFRLIPLNLFVSRNLTLILLPLSGFLDSLLRNLIAPTPGLALFLLMSRTLAASSFSSGRTYPSINFLPLLFVRLSPIPIMQGSTSL